jgi:hypothetical protein
MKHRKYRVDTIWYEKDELTVDQIRIAGERTAPMLRDFSLLDHDLPLLLRCCYLQGLRDMADALIANPAVLRGAVEGGDDPDGFSS